MPAKNILNYTKKSELPIFFVLQQGEVQIEEKLDVLSLMDINKIDNALAIVKIFGSRVMKP